MNHYYANPLLDGLHIRSGDWDKIVETFYKNDGPIFDKFFEAHYFEYDFNILEKIVVCIHDDTGVYAT